MFKPKNKISKHTHLSQTLDCQFSLLVWNIHKENQKARFAKKFSTLLEKHPSDILLFQEVKYPKNAPFLFENYSFSLAANLETKQNLFGVLTAANSSFQSHYVSLTQTKELGFVSHKSFLISRHPLCSDKQLYIINIHAINFVSHKNFQKELHQIKKRILELNGPLIICGDFNNWNKKRLQSLNDFQKELSLQKLNIDAKHHIKKVFTHTIDHIYYRGLQPLNATAIDTKNISDHNPIHAVFKLQK